MEQSEDLLIFVLFDGIANSVFQGQVLQPLIKKIEYNPKQKIILISFEKTRPTINLKIPVLSRCVASYRRIELIICKKYPFMGKLSLYPEIYQLKKILKNWNNYQLVARGPIAGWVCKKSLDFKKCRSFTIQARGLLAAECRYIHSKEKNPIKKLCYTLKAKQLECLEKSVYGSKDIGNYFNRFSLNIFEGIRYPKTIVEAVSNALKDYLIKQFGVEEKYITIAKKDIPIKFKPGQVATWKRTIRQKLNIPITATVYCYNGSIKPWQCPDKVVNFFKKTFEKSDKNFLLVLTQDTNQFVNLIKQNCIPTTHYAVIKVHHPDIYQYLSACDYGLIFRENNVINWVSRPTKALEYLCVGLKIIHNNTVEWVTNLSPQTGCSLQNN